MKNYIKSCRKMAIAALVGCVAGFAYGVYLEEKDARLKQRASEEAEDIEDLDAMFEDDLMSEDSE